VRSVLGLAVILGPGLGAVLSLAQKTVGDCPPVGTLPFWVGGAICLLNFLFIVCLFKETRAKRPASERTIEWGHANPFNNWRLLLTTKRVIYFAACYWTVRPFPTQQNAAVHVEPDPLSRVPVCTLCSWR
jgi:hypothetical protein